MFDFEKFLNKEFDTYMSGRNFYFNCPFCQDRDKGRNYWFNPDKEFTHKSNRKKYKGVGHCFRCEKTHSVLSFVMEYKKLDIRSALSYIEGDKTETSVKELLSMLDSETDDDLDLVSLVDRFTDGLKAPMPKGSSRDLPKALTKWFTDKRGYPRELLDFLDVHYCYRSETHPDEAYNKDFGMKLISLRNRAIFPEHTGNNSGWQGYLFKEGKYNKTMNPPIPVISKLLFRYDFSKNSKTIIVNEGIFDALRTMSRDFYPVALFGKYLSQAQAYFLSETKAEEICMCLDGGKKEWLQSLRNCLTLEKYCDCNLTLMSLPHGLDPDDCPKDVFKRSFRDRIEFLSSGLSFDSNGKITHYNGVSV